MRRTEIENESMRGGAASGADRDDLKMEPIK